MVRKQIIKDQDPGAITRQDGQDNYFLITGCWFGTSSILQLNR